MYINCTDEFGCPFVRPAYMCNLCSWRTADCQQCPPSGSATFPNINERIGVWDQWHFGRTIHFTKAIGSMVPWIMSLFYLKFLTLLSVWWNICRKANKPINGRYISHILESHCIRNLMQLWYSEQQIRPNIHEFISMGIEYVQTNVFIILYLDSILDHTVHIIVQIQDNEDLGLSIFYVYRWIHGDKKLVSYIIVFQSYVQIL